MKLLGRSWYLPFYEPLSCIGPCWRKHCCFCPLLDLDALPSPSPDRSHNGKSPPAVSLLLWDSEHSGLKGVIQVTDSKRVLLLELITVLFIFLIITCPFRTSFSILCHLTTDNFLFINIKHRCTWSFRQLRHDKDGRLVLSFCRDIWRGV